MSDPIARLRARGKYYVVGALPLAVATLIATMFVGAERADAYVIGGERWPGHTISYYNTVPQYRDIVKTAAWAWRISGVNVRFVPARSRRSADFVVKRYPGHFGCDGLSSLGRETWREPFVLLSDSTCVDTAIHEFGHQLGLDHSDRRCSVMYNGSGPSRGRDCERFEFDDPNRLCRMIKNDDIAGVARVYGRVGRPVRTCPPWAPPEPANLSIVATATGALELRGKLPTVTPTTPWARTLFRWTSGFWPRVDIAAAYDACPPPKTPDKYGNRLDAVSGRYGKAFRWPLPEGSGTNVCFTIVTIDSIGQSRTTQHVLALPPQPPPVEVTPGPAQSVSSLESTTG